ncbi:hypothetical protein D3C74_492440 [compost metagenome]
MFLQPSPILVDIGGIHNEHIVLLRQLVDQQIIHHTAIRITHQGILGLARYDCGYIIGGHAL